MIIGRNELDAMVMKLVSDIVGPGFGNLEEVGTDAHSVASILVALSSAIKKGESSLEELAMIAIAFDRREITPAGHEETPP